MKPACPWCRLPVPAGNIDLATGLARCAGCGTVFRFDAAPEVAPAPPPRPRPLQAPPECVQVREEHGGIVLTYRWFWFFKYAVLALFTCAWDSMLVEWYQDVLRHGPMLMGVVAVGHLAIGVALT